jgi:hypothetical protein
MIESIPRDQSGRFRTWKGTAWEKFYKKKVGIDDVRNAYIAGLNDHSGLAILPSVKANRYLKNLGIIR